MGRILDSQKNGTTSTLPTSNKPVGRISSKQAINPPKKTLGGKIIKGVGDVAKAIVSPVATMVARPVQLAANIAGVPIENIDKFTLDGLIAPTPKSSKDVVKDIGRGIQTVALGLPTTNIAEGIGGAITPTVASLGSKSIVPTAKLLGKSLGMGAEGAVFGLGAGLEQGNIGKNIAISAGISAALPIVGAGISKVLGKTASKTASKVAPKVEQRIAQEVPTSTEGKFIQPKQLVDGVPKIEIDGGVGKLHGAKAAEWGGYQHDFLRSKKLGGNGAFIDVGLEVNGVEKLTPENVLNKIKELGGKVEVFEVIPKSVDGEATVIMRLTDELSDDVMNKLTKDLEQDAIPQWSNKIKQATPEQPIQRKIPEVEYKNIKSKIENDYSDYDNFSKSDEFKDVDPEYIKQSYTTRNTASLDYIANNGIDDAFDVARGKRGVSPDAGFTAPAIKDVLLKSGKLSDDQTYRLLNSKAVESMSGSSLQSVTPLQSFISKSNEAVKKTYKRKIVANKKTIRSLFEGLECE